ncbi:MAG TPA: serine protease [Patescibacteria group bacterium]|nr:serine protease [Patescibacteria group bacterium]
MNGPDTLFVGDDSPTLAEIAKSQAVCVETAKSYGGGVLVVSGIVITCLHFIRNQGEICVNGKPAKLIHTNKAQDLAALCIDQDAPWVKFCLTPRLEEVVVFTAPIRIKKQFRLVTSPEGRITYVAPDVLCASMLTELGSCGSGLWSQQGLLGLVASDENLGFTQAVPSRILQRFAVQSYRILHNLQKSKGEANNQRELPFVQRQGQLPWQ